MDTDGMSLKEVLWDVSRKLDRFLESHQALHNEMALREERVSQQLSNQRELVISLREMEDRVDALREWQVETTGQLKLIRWATSGGLVAVGAMILRLLGVPVP